MDLFHCFRPKLFYSQATADSWGWGTPHGKGVNLHSRLHQVQRLEEQGGTSATRRASKEGHHCALPSRVSGSHDLNDCYSFTFSLSDDDNRIFETNP